MKFNPYLTPKQAESIRRSREARIAVWEGSVRSSKTILSILAFLEWLPNAPQGRIIIAGRGIASIRRNIMDPMIEMVGDKLVRPTYANGLATIMGRRVELLGVDTVSSESRLRGATVAGALVDEVTILASGKEWWAQLVARCSVPGARIFATTNPDSPSHWFLPVLEQAELEITQQKTVKQYKSAPPLGIHRYRFTLDDNPNLTEEYKEGLKGHYRAVPAFYNRNVLGLWQAAEGAIFPHYQKTTHWLPESEFQESVLNRGGKWCVGIDHGTTNPTHALRVGIDPNGERVLVDQELRLTDQTLTVSQQVEKILAWVRSWGGNPQTTVFVVDPAAKGFRNELRQQTGKYPLLGQNAVKTGIEAMGSLLGTKPPTLLFYQTPELDRELNGYRWDSKLSDKGVEAPVKQDDHGVDSLRYSIMFLEPTWKRWRMFKPPPPQPLDPAFLP